MQHQRRAARTAEVAAHTRQQATFAEQVRHERERLRFHQDLFEYFIVVQEIWDVLHPGKVRAGFSVDTHLASGRTLDARDDGRLRALDLRLTQYVGDGR